MNTNQNKPKINLKHKLVSLNLKKNRKKSKTPNQSLINNLENLDNKDLNPNNFSFDENQKKENTDLLSLLSQLKKQNKLLKETVTKSINFNITNNKINFSFDKPSEIIKRNNQIEKEKYNKLQEKNDFDFENNNLDSLLINEDKNIRKNNSEIINNNLQMNKNNFFNNNSLINNNNIIKENSIEEELRKLKEENEKKERIIKEHEEKEKKRIEEEEKRKKENEEKEKLLKELEEKNKKIKEQEEKEKLEKEIREKIEKELKEKEEKEKIEKEKKLKEENERIEREKKEKEEKERIEREKKEKELEEKLKKEKEEKENLERQLKEMKEREKKLKEEEEKKLKEEEEKKLKEEEEKKLKEEEEKKLKKEEENKKLKEKEKLKEEEEKKLKEEEEKKLKEEEEKQLKEEVITEELEEIEDSKKNSKKEEEEKSENYFENENSINKSNITVKEETKENNTSNINLELEDIEESISSKRKEEEKKEEEKKISPEVKKVINTFLNMNEEEENNKLKSTKKNNEDNEKNTNEMIEKIKLQREKEKEQLMKEIKEKEEEEKKNKKLMNNNTIEEKSENNSSEENINKKNYEYKEKDPMKILEEYNEIKNNFKLNILKDEFQQISEFNQKEEPYMSNSNELPSNLNYQRRKKAFMEQNYFSNYIMKEKNIVEQVKKMNKNYQDILEENLKQYEQKKAFSTIFNLVIGDDNNFNQEIEKLYKEVSSKKKKNFNYKSKIGPIESMENFAMYYNLSKADNNEFKTINQNFNFWRRILVDGNSFYRTFIFSLIEYYIFKKNLHEIKKIILGIARLSDEEVVVSDKKIDFKKILAVFSFIYNCLEKKKYYEAYLKFIYAYEFEKYDFDEAMIIYCRYVIFCNVDELYNNAIRGPNGNINNLNNIDKVDPNSILRFSFEPLKIVFNSIPLIFNVNLEIISLDGGLNKDGNNFKIYYNKFTDFSINELPMISIGYFFSSYFKIYTKDYQKNILKDFSYDIFSKENQSILSRNLYVDNEEELTLCKKCNKETKFVYLINNNLFSCENCFKKDIDTILKQRTNDYSKEKYNNLEYYTRDIIIKDKININDYDIIYLTGMNIISYLVKNSKSLCCQCGKPCFTEILEMKCGCQFCKECLMQNLEAATNGDIYQNKFEKKYAEKFGCLCKNVFEPEEAFNLLKLDPNKYRVNALNRMNQYVGIFCMICGSQLLDGGDEMMVNSNRTNDNYFRFKIKKPDNLMRELMKEQRNSQRSNTLSNNNGNINSNNNEINSIGTNIYNNGRNLENEDEISFCDHVICANCIEKELQKDAQNYDKKNQDKVFHCKICDVDHVIEYTQWNKIFKKGCCSNCLIF